MQNRILISNAPSNINVSLEPVGKLHRNERSLSLSPPCAPTLFFRKRHSQWQHSPPSPTPRDVFPPKQKNGQQILPTCVDLKLRVCFRKAANGQLIMRFFEAPIADSLEKVTSLKTNSSRPFRKDCDLNS